MRICSRAPFILGAAMLLAGPPAFGGAGEITTTVTPISSTVTYSRDATDKTPALVTYVGYTVEISNVSGNTINNIRFTGTTSVTDPQETAVYNSAEGVTCTTSAGGTSIDCSIGQLKAGVPYPMFAVFFKAPKKDTVSPTPDGDASLGCTATDCVRFTGTTYYAEGTGGVPQSTPINSTTPWVSAPVTLGTTNIVNVKSAVPKGGGTLFTGAGAVATATDTWATAVVVPPTTGFTSAEILEATTAITCAPDLLTCSTSTLTIPGSFANLVIYLRRDVTTIAKNAKIGSARVYYDAPSNPDIRISYPYEVLPCTDTTWGTLPQKGIPCIKSRTEFTKRTAPTPEWEGDWQFEIWALDNGRYVN